ncbi:quinone oxidoreductase family protein [Peribacillus glennii]|uniref:NADPH:quinone oxidoreductase family protein n=1 Tax=Peribacillus glennii TaxID=2303991 RepID=A0A372LCB8_9BACI|nr:NADPH:quinone oxidoreductase family protein [Peribacillus glennii]RFU63489.1 NADPH:quinone oxidoreductase family protein [Peribacillus glennii]
MKAIQLKEYGGPEVLNKIEIDKPVPKGHEVLIEVHSVGVNYADTARRQGQYVVPTPLPFIPGAEIAGVVTEVGDKVTRIKPGTRIVSLIESGGYSEYALANEFSVIPLPDNVDFHQAAALPLQGLSAYHVLKTMGRLEPGETVLIHAAAGGVGTIAVQLAKIFGAGKVIATASSSEKLELARDMGADVLIDYTMDGWEKEVLDATAGKGADVALEMAGGDVFNKTLKCLATFGRLVVFGNASGEQVEFNPTLLMRRNQSVIGFFLPQIMKKPDLLLPSIQELFTYVAEGKLKLTIGGVYPLEEAANVHTLLQGRQTKGKLILEVKR